MPVAKLLLAGMSASGKTETIRAVSHFPAQVVKKRVPATQPLSRPTDAARGGGCDMASTLLTVVRQQCSLSAIARLDSRSTSCKRRISAHSETFKIYSFLGEPPNC